MPMRRFERIALELMLSGCAVMFGACVFAQAQPGYVPPPTPLPPPVLNPSNPGTVPQPSYRPITPSTPSIAPTIPSTVPANEERPRTTARSERQATVEKPRSVHHYRHYHRGSPVVTYSCGSLGCARTYAWAFPCQYYSRYCYPYGYTASALWWPGY
jgi:hypothetical protein